MVRSTRVVEIVVIVMERLSVVGGKSRRYEMHPHVSSAWNEDSNLPSKGSKICMKDQFESVKMKSMWSS